MFLHYGVGEDSWVPWTARRSNQSILKEISPEYSLERLMLKLKLQYFGCLMQRTDSFEKTLMLGKIEGRSRRGWQRMKWLNGITDSMDMRLSKLQQIVKDRGSLVCCSPQGGKESGTTEWLNNKKQMIYFTMGELGLLVLWETLVHVTQVVIACQGCRLPLSPWPSLTTLQKEPGTLLLPRRWMSGLPLSLAAQVSVFLWHWLPWNHYCLNGFCLAVFPLPWSFGQRFIYLLILKFFALFGLSRWQLLHQPAWDTGNRICLHHGLTIAQVCSYLCFFQPSLSGWTSL